MTVKRNGEGPDDREFELQFLLPQRVCSYVGTQNGAKLADIDV
jgi:hypothetical protein